EKMKTFIRAYKKIFLYFLIIIFFVWIAFLLHIDKRIIGFSVVIVGFITQLFMQIMGLIALIPVIGPLIVKIVTLPFIIIVNFIGYIVTLFAFKKGYKVEVAKSKMFTSALLIGIVIGFIVGKLL
ncbi:hypothetical protein KAU15_01450, partial [candidate division WOR-3 bacterium]|nr:hypothetical protein [candidate division WOR-3 bacterium]